MRGLVFYSLDLVTLTVYNMMGQPVSSLIDRQMEAGTHEITFNATGLATGVYIYEMKTGSHVSRQKMILMQ